MRLVVLGAGFGGLEVVASRTTTRLTDKFGDVVTLIDKSEPFKMNDTSAAGDEVRCQRTNNQAEAWKGPESARFVDHPDRYDRQLKPFTQTFLE